MSLKKIFVLKEEAPTSAGGNQLHPNPDVEPPKGMPFDKEVTAGNSRIDVTADELVDAGNKFGHLGLYVIDLRGQDIGNQHDLQDKNATVYKLKDDNFVVRTNMYEDSANLIISKEQYKTLGHDTVEYIGSPHPAFGKKDWSY
jgi:hypothetical protein